MTAPKANVLNAAPRRDATYGGTISHKTIFFLRAFEPADAELAAATGRVVEAADKTLSWSAIPRMRMTSKARATLLLALCLLFPPRQGAPPDAGCTAHDLSGRRVAETWA